MADQRHTPTPAPSQRRRHPRRTRRSAPPPGRAGSRAAPANACGQASRAASPSSSTWTRRWYACCGWRRPWSPVVWPWPSTSWPGSSCRATIERRRPPASTPGATGRDEFHDETERLAEEARRVADDVREASYSWRAPGPDAPRWLRRRPRARRRAPPRARRRRRVVAVRPLRRATPRSPLPRAFGGRRAGRAGRAAAGGQCRRVHVDRSGAPCGR